jgi:hypothetical protein
MVSLLYQKMSWHAGAGMSSLIMPRTRLAAPENEWHN